MRFSQPERAWIVTHSIESCVQVTKGFFDGAFATGEVPEGDKVAGSGAFGMSAEEIVGAEDMEGAWGGDDDLDLGIDSGDADPMAGYPTEPKGTPQIPDREANAFALKWGCKRLPFESGTRFA